MSALVSKRWAVFLLAAFLFRLGFGLASDFWTEDERQVYLIGLKAYARGAWPYFGADVVWTETRLPGALQGVLIAAPLRLWRVPESPFILLNVLSFSALCLLAWYASRRVPELPRGLLWAWILTMPWTLHFSTHIVNTSYILPAAVVFFVGFFEAVPALRKNLLPAWLAFGMMGAALLWLVQIHMSWAALPLYVVVALALASWRAPARLARLSACVAAGALLTGAFLLPTLLTFGTEAIAGTQQNLQFEPQSPWTLVTILARFLSFTGFELNRFLGLSTARRLVLFADNPWLVPITIPLWLLGLLQPLAVLVLAFRRAPWPEWNALRILAALTVLWIWISYFFSVKEPLAHAFYVFFPVALLFSVYAWALVLTTPGRQRAAAIAVAAGVVFHIGFALARLPERSLYHDRALVQQAITTPDDRFLGERRVARFERDSVIATPVSAAFADADAATSVEIVDARWSRRVGGRVSYFLVTLRNRGQAAAWGDIRLATRYRDSAGHELPAAAGQVIVKHILEPGVTRTYELVDGMLKRNVASGYLLVAGAEKCVPVPGR
jgi:hypothetical protein